MFLKLFKKKMPPIVKLDLEKRSKGVKEQMIFQGNGAVCLVRTAFVERVNPGLTEADDNDPVWLI